ncbi:MAG: trypsin-like peptidase domain-containing protein [archaeon]
MPLTKHHKIVIGSFSGFLIAILIANSIFIYILYGQLQLSYNRVEADIKELKEDTQSKFNDLTTVTMHTQTELNSLGMQIGTIGKEFDKLGDEINAVKASASSDFSGVIGDAIKSVVTVRTNVGQGTGFIITDDGYIVTNAHVLSGGSTIQATTYEQKTLNANLIGYNGNLDIALLKIEGGYDKLNLDNSDDVEVGEKVIAIGNPLGLQFSVSEGIVSAVHRAGPNGIEAYIQTDAALNPGNSGGPLINKQGKVIGINNFKVGGGESLGFALESNFIESTVNDIASQELQQTLI